MSGIQRVVIVGGGHAGGEAAGQLRAHGFAGDITLIGEEPLAPYQRPPLSKAYLSGALSAERLLIRPAEVYAEEGVRLVLGRKVIWLDRQTRRVRLEGGQEIPYDALILATGGRARRPPTPGIDLVGVFTLRTAADVDFIRPRFLPGARLAVIGAGYIGLEVAAVARTLGLHVTVIEAAQRPLARVTSPEMAGFFLDRHAGRGVRFALGVQAEAILPGPDGAAAGVALADGTTVEADLVIVGVGIAPETQLAELSGLVVEDGVVTDSGARTSDPAVFAIGDCARRPLACFGGRLMRLESVHNAIEGAKIAAATITGAAPPIEEIPWFWSDQYDLKLTMAGLSAGYDAIVQRGAPEAGSFALFYYRGSHLLAVDAVNRPGEYLGAKQILQKGATIAPALLQDMGKSMKQIVTEALAGAAHAG